MGHVLDLVEDYAGGLVDLVDTDDGGHDDQSQANQVVEARQQEDVIVLNAIRLVGLVLGGRGLLVGVGVGVGGDGGRDGDGLLLVDGTSRVRFRHGGGIGRWNAFEVSSTILMGRDGTERGMLKGEVKESGEERRRQ